MLLQKLENIGIDYISDDVFADKETEAVYAKKLSPKGKEVEITYIWDKKYKIIKIQCQEVAELVDVDPLDLFSWMNRVSQGLVFGRYQVDSELTTLSFEIQHCLADNDLITEEQLVSYSIAVLIAADLYEKEFEGVQK